MKNRRIRWLENFERPIINPAWEEDGPSPTTAEVKYLVFKKGTESTVYLHEMEPGKIFLDRFRELKAREGEQYEFVYADSN
ncbi:MAG: hypothetical protein ABJB22_02880 [Verrucomicrobiota bacterium]